MSAATLSRPRTLVTAATSITPAIVAALGSANIEDLWVVGEYTTTSSGVIDSITDARGSGGHTASATGTVRPTYVASGMNGHPVARFDGVNDMLAVAGEAVASGPRTVIAVFNPVSAAGTFSYLLDDQNGRMILGHLTSTANTTGYYDGAWHDAAAATTGAQILSFALANAGGTVYRNGVSIGTGTYTEKALGGAVGIGSSYDGANSFLAMDLACLIIVNGINAGRHAAEVALGSWYGISVT